MASSLKSMAETVTRMEYQMHEFQKRVPMSILMGHKFPINDTNSGVRTEKKWLRRKVKMYGALKYPAISNVVPVEKIELEITDTCQDSCSLTPYPEALPRVPTILHEENNSVIAQLLIEKINIDIDLLTRYQNHHHD